MRVFCVAGAASMSPPDLPEEADMRGVLALLVFVTLACGIAAGVTMNLTPAYADGGGY